MLTRESRRFAAVIAAGFLLTLMFGERAYAAGDKPPIVTAPSIHPDVEENSTGFGENFTATITGGLGVAWAAGSGLPPGIVLAADGIYFGTPTLAGNYNFIVTATDIETGLLMNVDRAHHIAIEGSTTWSSNVAGGWSCLASAVLSGADITDITADDTGTGGNTVASIGIADTMAESKWYSVYFNGDLPANAIIGNVGVLIDYDVSKTKRAGNLMVHVSKDRAVTQWDTGATTASDADSGWIPWNFGDTQVGCVNYIYDLTSVLTTAAEVNNCEILIMNQSGSGADLWPDYIRLFVDYTVPAGGGSAWTPAEITTVLWLDAADAATITESGGLVSQWDDKSGSGNNVTQVTGALQPTTGTRTLNGLNVLDFAADWLEIDPFAKSEPFTVFMVATVDVAAQASYVMWGDANSNNPAPMLYEYSNVYQIYGGGGQPNRPSDTNPHVFGVNYDSSALNVYVDGTGGTPSATTATAMTGLQIGARNNSAGDSLDGMVGEFVFVDGAMSDADREKMEGYLAWKWGLEGNLPAAHPYKAAAPAAPTWTPADITTWAWWDPSDTSTITESGGAVSQIDDKSGNGNHATGAGGSEPTTGTRTIGGLNVLDYQTGDWLTFTTVDMIGKEMWAVFNGDSWAGDFTLLGHGGNSQMTILSSGQVRLWSNSTPYNPDNTAAAQTAVIGTDYVIGWLSHSATQKQFSVNGVLTDNAGIYDGTSSQLHSKIGRSQYTTATDGVIGEIVIVDAELSTADREKMEGYLAWKWGLEGNLPSGHPYEFAPPGAAPPPPPAGELTLDSATYSQVEGDGSTTDVTITVTRSGGTTGTVQVDYDTADDTAWTSDSDYVAASGTLSWANGVGGSQTFTVTITGDVNPEPDEDIIISLSNETVGVTLGISTATLTITTDETLPAITSALPPATGNLSVAYAHTFTADGIPAPTFSVTAGTLPAGLSLDSVTGLLDGTPTSAATFAGIEVTATNASGTDTTLPFTITVSSVVMGWSYNAWTGDADSGIDSSFPYTAAHHWCTTHTGPTIVTGVSFGGGRVTSGTGWTISGSTAHTGDSPNITGDSLSIADQFVYNGNPRTITLSGLTIGQDYKMSLFSVAWETGSRVQTFSSDGNDLVLNQDEYDNNNGIVISYTYTATATTQVITITPVAGTFHMYAMTNREMAASNPSPAVTLDAPADLATFASGVNPITLTATATDDSAVTQVEFFYEGSSSPWTPADISTVAWFDAADAATITEASGAVSAWNDKSGNNNHAVQATGAEQPTYTASDPLMNNLPSIGSVSNSDFKGLVTPSMTAQTIYGVFYYKDGVDATFDVYSTIIAGPGSNSTYRAMGTVNSANWIATSSFSSTGAYKNGAAAVSLVALPMPASLFKFKAGADRVQPYSIGRYEQNSGSDRDWVGAYSEFIFTDGTEDLATEQMIEGYLAWKWDLQGSLDGAHPYKSAAPGGAAGVPVSIGVDAFDGDDAYTFNWVSPPDGEYILTAVATDDGAATTVSAAANIVIGSTISIAMTTAAAEPATDGLFTLTRSGDTALAITVNYTVAGTATPGADYTALSGTASFAASATSATIDVFVLDDGDSDAGETVEVTIVAGTDYVPGATPMATMTIVDDDMALPLTIPGCVLWYDAADAATITKDGSNLVSKWDDKSSSGFDLSETTRFPTYNATALNGLGGVDFYLNKDLSAALSKLSA